MDRILIVEQNFQKIQYQVVNRPTPSVFVDPLPVSRRVTHSRVKLIPFSCSRMRRAAYDKLILLYTNKLDPPPQKPHQHDNPHTQDWTMSELDQPHFTNRISIRRTTSISFRASVAHKTLR
jgi:hypothetical protein